ncbi:hypothetical protein HYY72_02585 [Candidatus Woesearchaeota archaeon]|nr:hypothetical protein [Candidatus Woesearchaeota archaeon]
MKTRFLESIAILVGATIGAGILGIPYVVSKAGFWTGILVILVLGAATLLINLYMGEIALRTRGNHQLAGYAEKYTGRIGKNLASCFMILGIYGALTAYLIGVGNSASAILGGNTIQYSLIFFIIVGLVVWRGIKSIGKAELLITAALILVVIAIPAFSAGRMSLNNFSGFDIYRIMIPYGVVLFAFMGTPAIPAMKEELNSNRKLLRNAIIIGTLIPLVVYLLFPAAVIGLLGNLDKLGDGERIATVALSRHIRPEIGILANAFAVLAMTTSFIALSFALGKTFQEDYRLSRKKSFAITFAVPISIFMINAFVSVTNFISILAIVGAVTGGITGILIVAMHYKAIKSGDRKPEYSIPNNMLIMAILIIIFAAGILNELLGIIIH